MSLPTKRVFFVVVTEGMYEAKGNKAIEKNFKKAGDKITQVKRTAVSLLNDLKLDKIVTDIEKAKKSFCKLFSQQKFTNLVYRSGQL